MPPNPVYVINDGCVCETRLHITRQSVKLWEYKCPPVPLFP